MVFSKNILKRLFCVLLSFTFFFCCPARPVFDAYAAAPGAGAGAVSVLTGGSGIGAGLGAVATSPVTAVVGVLVLGALGVNVFVSHFSSAQGETKTQWISRKMQEYAEFEGSNFEQLEKDIAYNTYVTSDGILHLKRSAAEKIKAFGDWLIGGGEAGSVPVYDAVPSGVISGDYSLGVYNGPISFDDFVLSISSSSPVYCFSYVDSSGNYSNCFCSAVRFTGVRYVNFTASSQTYYLTPGVPSYIYYYEFWTRTNIPGLPVLSVGSPGAVYRSILSNGVVAPSSGIIGNPVDWAQNEDVINLGLPDGGAVSVDPDLLGGLDLSNVATDQVIGLGDYLDALADAINGLSDKVIDLHDALALEDVITVPVPDTIDPAITVPVDPAITVPDSAVNVIEGTVPSPVPDPDPTDPESMDGLLPFVPDDITGFFDKFNWLREIYLIISNLLSDIQSDASGASAPQVMLNFPSREWYGVRMGNYHAVDLAWYAPYKSSVDGILSGFFWLCYLWMIFKRAPSIISGSSMAEGDFNKIALERSRKD